MQRFVATARAAMRTRRVEKIRMLARLLVRGTFGELRVEDDEYDELLGIVEELSVREFQLLVLLQQYEDATPRTPQENWLQWNSKFWADFLEEAAQMLETTTDEVIDRLFRLTRTGCYRIVPSGYWDYRGDHGFTTKTFRKITKILRSQVANET